MYKHPIPKQITTFEFKLIGFLTLKQFGYLIIFVPLGYLTFFFTPIPYLNILMGLAVAGIGAALAFLRIQDRPLEVWIANFYKSINSPTIYIYQPSFLDLSFLKDVFISDEKQTKAYLTASNYLSKYRSSSVKQISDHREKKKFSLSSLFFMPNSFKAKPQQSSDVSVRAIQSQSSQTSSAGTTSVAQSIIKPFLSGVVYSTRKVVLPGILVYIKDSQGKVVRLMKSNVHGVFATFKPLPEGQYKVIFQDPSSTNTFDTINLSIEKDKPLQVLEVYAKQ
ncbi:MAG: hypothetical protein KatS3mg090_0053 [Patescibacteria group bacterium]|nr:MAG: hypothetical protein KatS3mg090_0053 [Patescibacteria group bacterium]